MRSSFPNKWLPYLLLAPSVFIVILFLIIPSIQSVYYSFYRLSLFGDKLLFVGWDNFQKLFSSSYYLNSILRTVVFAAFVVFVGLFIGMSLAVMLNQKLKGMFLYRTLFIWTYALSPAVAGTIWALIFSPSSGPFNFFLEALFGTSINWMTDSTIALLIVAVAATWKMMGYNIIFFLAGLQAIPNEMLEAASIDGAGAIRKFFRVTLPLLSPTTFFLLIMNMMYAFFEVFGLIDIMTKGGPGDATQVLVYKLYKDGFVNFNTGLASAQSVTLFLFVAVLTILQFRFTERKVFYS
ncbi:MAG: sugar ABC transporter permease [Thermotogaceae bacterium]|nr:sugar ABC transporter permease [Thermotogaceae bacterium]